MKPSQGKILASDMALKQRHRMAKMATNDKKMG